MDHHHQPHQHDSSDLNGDEHQPPAGPAASDDQPEAQGQATGHVDVDDVSGATTGNVLELIAQVDEQLKRIRDAQHVQEDELASLTERFHQLEASEQANEQEKQSLVAERESIAQRREEVERMQIELGREREQWESVQREREHQVNQQHESLRQREEELARRQEEINGALDRLREREEQLQQQHETTDSEREQLNHRVEEAENRLAEAESRVSELTQQLAATRLERDASNDQLAEQTRQLELAGSKLREFSEALNQQNAQLNQASSAVMMAKRQERIIAELKEQLAANRSDDAGQADASEEFARQLHERDQHIESLNQTIEQLRRELTELIEQREAAAAQEGESSSSDEREAEMQSLRDRITELEQELAAAKNAAATAAAQQGDQVAPEKNQHEADALREKAKRIAQIATHIRRRHNRLKRMRQLLRERAGGVQEGAPDASEPTADAGSVHDRHEAIMQQMQEIEHQREHVKQMRAALAATERKMIRQWAKPRTVTVMLGLLVLLAANIVAAWGLTNKFVPAERTASITIEPRVSAGRTMEQADTERWQQWHATIVHDDSFMRSLATRLRERRLDEFSDPQQLKTTFSNHLTVDLGPRGEVTYTLAGRDQAALTGVLDVLASTVVIESDRQAGARGDRAPAVARNERQEGGTLRYALMNGWTLHDHRLLWMLPFLAGTLLLTAIAVRLVYTRLIRTKQLFDEDTSVVDHGDNSSAMRPVW